MKEWHVTEGWQEDIAINRTAHDNLKNIYVAGQAQGIASEGNYVTVKYDSNGSLIWVASYDRWIGSNDYATAIHVDASYNVYVTGCTEDSLTGGYDYTTIKYDNSGIQQWVVNYNGPANDTDVACALTVDGSGNVYVTGTSKGSTTNWDIATVKYNSSGAQQWVARRDSANKPDIGVSLNYNSSTNRLLVGGFSTVSGTKTDYTVLQYNVSGTLTSRIDINSLGFVINKMTDLAVDDSNNVYVTGYVLAGGGNYDFRTAKLDSNLVRKWQVDYNRSGADDRPADIEIDDSLNVYIAGYSTTVGTGKDYTLVKYDKAGTLKWEKHRNGSGNGEDAATALKLDRSYNAYVTGRMWNGRDFDFGTIKYKAGGGVEWSEIFEDGTPELANNIILNSSDVIVSGQTYDSIASKWEYLTVKYSQEGIFVPYNNIRTRSQIAYFPNVGQIRYNDSTAATNIYYFSKIASPQLFLGNRFAEFIFRKIEFDTTNPQVLIDSGFAFRCELINTPQEDIRFVPFNETNYFDNYYLSFMDSPGKEIRGYGNISMQNVYDGIDWQFSSDTNGVIQYLVVHPYHTTADIELSFVGIDSLKIDSSFIEIQTKGGTTNWYVKAWQATDTGYIIVPISITKSSDSTMIFNLGAYDSSYNLVIEIDEVTAKTESSTSTSGIDWSTYIKGYAAGWDNNFGITSDDQNLFSCGRATSLNLPTTVGVFQPNLNGSEDAFIAAFEKGGKLIWMTYWGGNDNDVLYSIDLVSAVDQIICVGGSSSSDLPMASNPIISDPSSLAYFDDDNDGSWDGILIRLNTVNGNVMYSSFIGGSDIDYCKSVSVNPATNSYSLTGITYSTEMYDLNTSPFEQGPPSGNFPLFNSGSGSYYYDENKSPALGDLFIMKFNHENELEWSTLFGSDGNENVYDIKIVKAPTDFSDYNIYIAGQSDKFSQEDALEPFDGRVITSGNFPLCKITDGTTDGYFDVGEHSGMDAFISKFSENGVLQWSTMIDNIDMIQDIGANLVGEQVYFIGKANEDEIGTPACDALSLNTNEVAICNAIGGDSHSDGQLYYAAFDKNKCDLEWSSLLYDNTIDLDLHWSVAGSAINELGGNPRIVKFLNIELDKNSRVFGFGTTKENTIIEYGGDYTDSYMQFDNSCPNGSNISDCFINIFQNNRSLIWATYFGAGENPLATDYTGYMYEDYAGGITIDDINNKIYLTGWSGHHNSFPLFDPGSPSYFYDGNDISDPKGSLQPFVSCVDISKLEIIEPTSIAATNDDCPYFVYPNPATSVIHLDNEIFGSGFKIEIYNSVGDILTSKISTNSNYIDISELPLGMYHVLITNSFGISNTLAFVKM